MLAFLKMGGYWAYVWPAYGLVFGALIGHWRFSIRNEARAKQLVIKKRSRLKLDEC